MARKKTGPKKKHGGPFLAAAVFCDNILRGDDGVMSVVRIVDRITLTVPFDSPLKTVPSKEYAVFTPPVWALVIFKKGDSGLKHEVRLVSYSPSGEKKLLGEQILSFTPEEHGGITLRIQCQFVVTEAGLYWVDVFLDGKRMTRMPLFIETRRAKKDEKPDGTRMQMPIVSIKDKKA